MCLYPSSNVHIFFILKGVQSLNAYESARHDKGSVLCFLLHQRRLSYETKSSAYALTHQLIYPLFRHWSRDSRVTDAHERTRHYRFNGRLHGRYVRRFATHRLPVCRSMGRLVRSEKYVTRRIVALQCIRIFIRNRKRGRSVVRLSFPRRDQCRLHHASGYGLHRRHYDERTAGESARLHVSGHFDRFHYRAWCRWVACGVRYARSVFRRGCARTRRCRLYGHFARRTETPTSGRCRWRRDDGHVAHVFCEVFRPVHGHFSVDDRTRRIRIDVQFVRRS